jgi:hypothetical protein
MYYFIYRQSIYKTAMLGEYNYQQSVELYLIGNTEVL